MIHVVLDVHFRVVREIVNDQLGQRLVGERSFVVIVLDLQPQFVVRIEHVQVDLLETFQANRLGVIDEKKYCLRTITTIEQQRT